MIKQIETAHWNDVQTATQQSEAINATENGKILLFPNLSFVLTDIETKFLSERFADPKAKNISYNNVTQKLRCAACSPEDFSNLKAMLQRFAMHANSLVQHLFPSYIPALRMGRTSFRPVEILGRVSSYRKDDTRLHVDAFPATPNQGQRILRVFTNIHPAGQARVWRVGEPFAEVAKRFLPQVRKRFFGEATLLKTLRITKSHRTEYDHIMLQIHDRMKADIDYQKNVTQAEIRFAPGTTWIVQTDHVSHAAMSGQHMLEQTFYLPVTAMRDPSLSPLRVLEQQLNRSLI